ncbi:helix-turn-helix transcriptional regulator [Novosphingobium album (ex Liu et al. 2023)]|nr:AlpA family phage regulatory protein [Novosphingobium album (ex Liu et al. 2023)]
MQDIVRETSLHRATIYRLIAKGEFPRPIPLGRQRVAWAERDVEQWKLRQLDHAAP